MLSKGIELSALIRELRAELAEAVATAPATGLQFELGPVEIEVSVGVDRNAGSDGKVKFWVVEMGSNASVTRSTVQRVTITLTPRTPDNRALPLVAGTEEPGER